MTQRALSSSHLGHWELLRPMLRTHRVSYFPVRHHSPACSAALARLIEAWKPTDILVEGPTELNPLTPLLLDERTRCPVAFYVSSSVPTPALSEGAANSERGATTTPTRAGAFYPFCDHSPEYVAMRDGARNGARLAWIDLSFENLSRRFATQSGRWTTWDERPLATSSALAELARQRGFRDFSELWDRLFEARAGTIEPDRLIDELTCYCHFARAESEGEGEKADEVTDAREQAMASEICRTLAREDSHRVLVVTGGYHTVVLPFLVADQRAHGRSASARPSSSSSTKATKDGSRAFLVRYTHDRLNVLSGYAAGLPSPTYYQLVWDALARRDPEPLRSAAGQLIVNLGRRSRAHGSASMVSPADEIATLEHATLLAQLRGSSGPTRVDILDAVTTTMIKGSIDMEGLPILSLWERETSVSKIGEIPPDAGVPPLVEDFRRRATRSRLSIDRSTPFIVTLELYRRASHRATSRLLHSLNQLQIPFAERSFGPDFVGGEDVDRLREEWECQWSPLVEAALMDASLLGETIEEAATTSLRKEISSLADEGQGRNALAAARTLIKACLMGLHGRLVELVPSILGAIDGDASFANQVNASRELTLLLEARDILLAHDLPDLAQLRRRALDRAVSLIFDLGSTSREATNEAIEALLAMREIAFTDDLVDRELLLSAMSRLVEQDGNAAVRAAAIGVLAQEGRRTDDDVVRFARGYLSGSFEDGRERTFFLTGLLRAIPEIAWQSTPFLEAMDSTVIRWPSAEFAAALPNLRLAMSVLSPREIDGVAHRLETTLLNKPTVAPATTSEPPRAAPSAGGKKGRKQPPATDSAESLPASTPLDLSAEEQSMDLDRPLLEQLRRDHLSAWIEPEPALGEDASP